MAIELDNKDREILNIIQTGFPVDTHPYAVIGEKTALAEDEAFNRVKRMYDGQVIRRIGATFESRRLHFTSTLCAVTVPPEKIDDAVKAISQCPEVTHNYERNHNLNIWFTVIAESKERIDGILDEISEKAGIEKPHNMPASRKFKIKVDFNFKNRAEEGADEEDEDDG